MKKIVIPFIYVLFVSAVFAEQSVSFTWIGNSEKSFNISFPLTQDNSNITVNWGDENVSSQITTDEYGGVTLTHTYTNEDDYIVTITVGNDDCIDALDISSQQVRDLDISNVIKIRELWCADNLLTDLDVSNVASLEELWCFKNQLTNLNIGEGERIISVLDCRDNALSLIKLYELSKKATSLTHLGNQYLLPVDVDDVIDIMNNIRIDAVSTVFTINNGSAIYGEDYTIDFSHGTLTFIKGGTYSVKMTNSAIQLPTVSYPPVVYVNYVVSLSSDVEEIFAEKEILKEEYFGIDGKPVRAATIPPLQIKRTIYTDGTVKVEKVITR
jgi:hypothetical protein